LEIALWYILFKFWGWRYSYLNLAISEFLIMLAITWSNYLAACNQCWCAGGPIFRQVTSFHNSDDYSEGEWSLTDILECQSLFQAFEKHLKREFSLEHLNFIVAIVHYHRLCEGRKHIVQTRKFVLQDTPQTMATTCQQCGEFSLTGRETSTGSPMSSRYCVDSSPTSAPIHWSPNCRNSPRRNSPRLDWIKSQIAEGADMEHIATFIFDEYCDRGAPQEINIGKKERDKLVEFFSRSLRDPAVLITIFDPAFYSVLDLLANDSLRRFRRSSIFTKYTKDLLVKNVYDLSPEKKTVSCRKILM